MNRNPLPSFDTSNNSELFRIRVAVRNGERPEWPVDQSTDRSPLPLFQSLADLDVRH